ncbi:MAG: type II toxin-antitoxin system HicA family toxin [Candidatus Brocadia sp.]
MPKFSVFSLLEFIKVLKMAGFEYVPKRGKGSHSAFVKRNKERTRLVIIPHKKEIPKEHC